MHVASNRKSAFELASAEHTDAPQIPCCQCGTILQIYLQPGTEDFEAAYFVTCVNVVCVMWGQTLSANNYPPANLELYLSSRPRDVIMELYLGLVSRESVQAAAAVGKIYVTASAQAALRAALIITIFRMEVQQNQWIPDIQVHSYLLRDYPEALPLLEYALGCCLQAWGICNREFVPLKLYEPTFVDATARVLASVVRNEICP